jgi:N4-gp56 family major capsid protein
MAIFDNLNMSTSNGVAPGVVDFYTRTLLENAKPEMVHARDAQKRTLPEHNGKHVQFRRMVPYAASTEPLKEGITPEGQEIRQTAFTAMVKPYGRHVEVTDELNYYLVDDMHREVANLLADQALLSLDTIVRDTLHTGMNVQFANGKSNRGAITAEDKLTPAEIKKAVRTLKRNNCKPFADGYYHAIVHPDAIYDLTGSNDWVDIAKYQDKAKIERYELGTMYKVKFFESTNAKTYTGKAYLFGDTAQLTIASCDEATRTCIVTEEISPDDARALTGQMVQVTASGTATLMCVERVDYDNKKITFRWMPQGGVSGKIQPEGATGDATVFGTLIYGQDAFGDIELGGNGGNVKTIINPPGSSGAADPLEQRGTIAWKVKGYTAVILQDAFMVRIEHGATA